MKNQTNLPGFISEVSLSKLDGHYRCNSSENSVLHTNTVLPQGLKEILFKKLIEYAFDHVGYAVCWWSCVIDGGGAVVCKRKCTAA